MKRSLLFLISIFAIPSLAQQSITLQQCYQLANENYPLSKQTQLLKNQNELDKEIISKAKLPQLSFDAQATYQSDVIEFPLVMSGIEPLNKDQYRATLSVNQLIYNAGATDVTLNLKTTQNKTKQKQIEVILYQLKQKINQLYFSVLLAQETELLLKAKQAQLQAKLNEIKSAIKYGVVLPSSDKILEAELLKIKQQFAEIENNRVSLVSTLSSIIGEPLNASTLFETTLITCSYKPVLNRPELELFQLKKEEIETNEVLLTKLNAPKLLGFANGGYGNPGLNILDNSFQTFYTVGFKLNWNVFDWNSNKKQRESLAINKAIIDTEAETFKLNTQAELKEQQTEIDKIEALINSDLEIINLRKEVLKSASSQLKNGVITSSAYITELTNLYEDENIMIRHKIQLQLAKANYNTIKGL